MRGAAPDSFLHRRGARNVFHAGPGKTDPELAPQLHILSSDVSRTSGRPEEVGKTVRHLDVFTDIFNAAPRQLSLKLP